jgi:hypothetical protein
MRGVAMASEDLEPADGWAIHLTSDGVAYVRAHISKTKTADTLLEALRTIEPLLPYAPSLDVDGDWAE